MHCDVDADVSRVRFRRIDSGTPRLAHSRVAIATTPLEPHHLDGLELNQKGSILLSTPTIDHAGARYTMELCWMECETGHQQSHFCVDFWWRCWVTTHCQCIQLNRPAS